MGWCIGECAMGAMFFWIQVICVVHRLCRSEVWYGRYKGFPFVCTGRGGGQKISRATADGSLGRMEARKEMTAGLGYSVRKKVLNYEYGEYE
jgi:hypothetical protein